jgi:hypothetical protein
MRGNSSCFLHHTFIDKLYKDHITSTTKHTHTHTHHHDDTTAPHHSTMYKCLRRGESSKVPPSTSSTTPSKRRCEDNDSGDDAPPRCRRSRASQSERVSSTNLCVYWKEILTIFKHADDIEQDEPTTPPSDLSVTDLRKAANRKKQEKIESLKVRILLILYIPLQFANIPIAAHYLSM